MALSAHPCTERLLTQTSLVPVLVFRLSSSSGTQSSSGRDTDGQTRVDALSSSGMEWAQEEKEVAATLKKNGYHSGSIYPQAFLP